MKITLNMSKKNYHNSIDEMILKKWWACMDGDYSNCRIDIEKEQTEQEDWEAWCIIHDSYLAEFGISSDSEQINDLRRQIIILQCEYIIDENNYLRNEIRRLKSELIDILDRKTGGDREDMLVHLEKWIGFRLNENEITVRKYYKVLSNYEKEIKATSKGKS